MYVTTGNNYSDPPTDDSDAIIAYDLESGKRLWSQQFTEGDAYNVACNSNADSMNCPQADAPDFDFGSSAITVNGVATKGGSLNRPGAAVVDGMLYVNSGLVMAEIYNGVHLSASPHMAPQTDNGIVRGTWVLDTPGKDQLLQVHRKAVRWVTSLGP